MNAKDFKDIITSYYTSQPEVIETYGLTDGKTFEEQFSPVSLESIMFYSFALALEVAGGLTEQRKIDITQIVNNQKAHRPNWCAEKAMLYQHGMQLISETDGYDNSGLSDDEIEAMRIVKFAAAYEPDDESLLYLKIATESGGLKNPLSNEQLTPFKSYLNRVIDTGVDVVVINENADELRTEIDIYYNPLILDNTGARIDGTSQTPTQDAIRNYISNLIFNGIYTNMQLVDAIQAVDGVEIVGFKSASTRRAGYTEFMPVDARVVAYSGYFTITDANLILNFIANG